MTPVQLQWSKEVRISERNNCRQRRRRCWGRDSAVPMVWTMVRYVLISYWEKVGILACFLCKLVHFTKSRSLTHDTGHVLVLCYRRFKHFLNSLEGAVSPLVVDHPLKFSSQCSRTNTITHTHTLLSVAVQVLLVYPLRMLLWPLFYP